MASYSFQIVTKMKLDPFSLVISIVALAIFFVPVIYDQMKKKKAKESEQDNG